MIQIEYLFHIILIISLGVKKSHLGEETVTIQSVMEVNLISLRSRGLVISVLLKCFIVIKYLTLFLVNKNFA